MATPSPTRVVLLGLMGSGKTTVGRELAHLTGWPYLDNDTLLSAATGSSLTELAAIGGEHLHDAERDILEDVLLRDPPLIAAAAAAVVGDPLVAAMLHHRAFSVYLHVPAPVLVDRVGGDTHRPFIHEDPVGVLSKMYDARDPLYRELAAFVADGTQPPTDVAAEIAAQLPRLM
jgi:shikimate kinase